MAEFDMVLIPRSGADRRTSYEDRVARGDRAGCVVTYSRRARSTCRNGAGPQGEAIQGEGERRERPWRQTAL